jgi:hypothetical protein
MMAAQGGVVRGLAWIAVVLTLGSARVATAEPRSMTGAYSDYEQKAIGDAERALRTTVEPAPEGKRIERIDFVRLDPIDRNDPLPTAIDVIHTTSRPWVIRRELLVAEGQQWSTVLVDESARNLRKLEQLSLVLCVPMRGEAPDTVRLVVITKDVWSLYVDFDLAVTSGGLESLTLEPKESNIAGIHHTGLARLVLEPKTLSLGASYHVPRLDGRWIDMLVDGNVIVNRDSGQAEGAYGSATVARPLVTSRTEWAWSTGTTFSNQLRRRYVNAAVATYDPDGARVPWVYRERLFTEQAAVTRSFGWESKNDVTMGASLAHARYLVPGDGALDPAAVAAFVRAAVPTGEDRVGPFVQWHAYTSDFLRTFDLDTLGLQEDVRLGYDAWARVYPVLTALGSSRDLVGTYAGLAYAVPLGDGAARASVESTVEATSQAVSDASVRGGVGVATPRFGIGRIVFTATALNRYRNYLNAQSFVGGDSLLRGYPSRYLEGKDLVASNVELRSRSIDLSSILLGAVLFYDVADAFEGFDRLRPRESVGTGLRIVFPQIERAVLRVDLGVPVVSGPRPADVPPMQLFVAFHQALSLPTLAGGP